MPMRDVFAAFLRRWPLALVGLLMTVGLSAGAYVVSKPTYEIMGTVLFLPPESSSDARTANPYLRLGGLGQAVDLVGVALSDQTTQLQLKAISNDVEFTVRADSQIASPLLVIDVKDSSAESAMKIRNILLDQVPIRLRDMQESLGVAPADRITSTVVTLDTQAQEVGKNRVRAAVAAAVVGLGLTVLATAFWDARRLRHPRRSASGGSRRSRNAATPAGAALTDPEEDVEETPVTATSPEGLEAQEEPADADALGHAAL